MKNIKEDIQKRIITSMKSKDSKTLSVLRNIKSLISNLEKSDKNVTDEKIQKLISKYVKQRKEGIEEAKKVNREDLIEKEKFEISILEDYLPKILDENSTRKIIEELVSNGANNIGSVMKSISSYGNKIDKKLASKLAREILLK